MFPDPRHLRILIPLLSFFCWFPAPLRAEQVLTTPSLAVREEYNDNIFSQASERRGDFVTTLSPSLAFAVATERMAGTLSGGVNQVLYQRNSGNNGLGYQVHGAGSYATTPRLALSCDLGATRDSSASSIDPATSLVTSSRTMHQNYRVGEKYQVSELISSSLSAGYGREDYDSSAYLGTTHYLASSDLGWDLGRLWPGLKLAQGLLVSRDETGISRVDSLSATIGFSKNLNERWALSVNGGGRYTHSHFRTTASTWGNHDEAGAVGSLSGSYTGEKGTANLTLSQDLSSASGRSGATQRTGVSLSLSHRFDQRISGSCGGGYARNWSGKDQFGGGAIDERYWSFNASLGYDLLNRPGDLVLEGGYTFNDTDYRLVGTRMHQDIVMLRLTWQRASTW